MNFKKKNAANAPAPNQVQQAARRRSLRSGAYASVLAVVVLVLVILLNLVVGAVPTKFTQFDISTGKMFTLSDTTKTMLQELNTDVTAYNRQRGVQHYANSGPLCGRKQPFYLAAARPRAVPHLCTAV